MNNRGDMYINTNEEIIKYPIIPSRFSNGKDMYINKDMLNNYMGINKGMFFNKKGSFTMEAMVIIPIVLLCIIFLIFASGRFYKAVLMQAAVDLAAQRGACTWNVINRDINTGKILSTLENITEPGDITAMVEVKDSILFKTLLVKARHGTQGEISFARAVVVEPAEFIRSIDFLVEAAGDIMDSFQWVNNFISKIKELEDRARN